MVDMPGPLGRERWRIPFETDIEADRIVWHANPLDRISSEAESGRLEMFLYLSGSADKIERFAHLYGLLGICEHDRPFRHGLVEHQLACAPTSGDRSGYETVAGWKHVIDMARRILRLADDVSRRPKNEELQRRLAASVEEWMVLADVRPILTGPRNPIYFQGSGLLGSLAVELLHEVASTDSFATCDGCGVVFRARRRRVAGQRTFCENCGRPAALRIASREYRAANAAQIRERDRERKRVARAAAKDTSKTAASRS